MEKLDGLLRSHCWQRIQIKRGLILSGRTASNILSALAQGKNLYGFNREDVLSVCKSVGFTTGFFSIDASAGKHSYILQETGKVIDVDKKIE